MIIVRKATPDYQNREEIECVTLRITQVSRLRTGNVEKTTVTARLDDGLVTEREVTWVHTEDHPIFLTRKTP